MEKDWILLNTYDHPNTAHVVKSLLEENGIQVVLINKHDSSYPVFGRLEIYCHLHQAAEAIDILDTINNE